MNNKPDYMAKSTMCTYTCLNFIPASPTFIPTWLNIILNCLYFVLTCLCFIPTCLHFIPTCLHSNMAVSSMNKQYSYSELNITYVSLSFLRAVTILNTAPGVKGLSQEYFQNTDILCLNETEVSLIYNTIHYAPTLRIHVYIHGCTCIHR